LAFIFSCSFVFCFISVLWTKPATRPPYFILLYASSINSAAVPVSLLSINRLCWLFSR